MRALVLRHDCRWCGVDRGHYFSRPRLCLHPCTRLLRHSFGTVLLMASSLSLDHLSVEALDISPRLLHQSHFLSRI